MRAKFLAIFLSTTCVFVADKIANAAWLSAYSGYSAFQAGSTDGYVSFAVWDRGPTLSDDLPLPSGASLVFLLGTSPLDGRYIYLYQIVNVQDGAAAVEKFRIYDLGFLELGYISNAVFSDSQGEIKSGNPALDNGTLGHPISGDDVVDGVPTLSGIAPAGLVNPTGSVIAPASVSFGSPPQYTQWDFPSPDYLKQGWSSLLLFGSSNLLPTYKKADARDGDIADMDVPATPEPGTLVGLAGLALTGGIVGWLRRKKEK